MTREEAIELIDDRMCFGRGKWSKHHEPEIDEYWQAGQMAIEALRNKNDLPISPLLKEPKQGKNGSELFDYISRQAAIDHWRLIIDATNTDSRYNMGFVDGLEFCISHLSTMPSAQPVVKDIDVPSTDTISRQAASNQLEKCYTCKHVYRRISDDDTLYCRCRKGCKYEEFKSKRSNNDSGRHED